MIRLARECELASELGRRNPLLEGALEHRVLVYGEPLRALAAAK